MQNVKQSVQQTPAIKQAILSLHRKGIYASAIASSLGVKEYIVRRVLFPDLKKRNRELVKLYRDGIPKSELIEKFAISKAAVNVCLRSEDNQIIPLYLEGFNPFEIAEKLGIKPARVRQHLGRSIRESDRINIEQVISLYKEGKTTVEVAAITGFSQTTISKSLRNHGVNRAYLRNPAKIYAMILSLHKRGVTPEEIAIKLNIDVAVVTSKIERSA